jgi:hypothetical protein
MITTNTEYRAECDTCGEEEHGNVFDSMDDLKEQELGDITKC